MQRRKRCWQQHVLLAMSCVFLISTLGALAQDVAATTAEAPAAAAAPADIAAAAPAGNVTMAPAAAEESPRISCRVHIANNTASPTTFGRYRSSLKVAAAADVMDVSLILQVQHPDVAALEVTLAAAGASGTKAKVTVKSPAFGAAGGANLVQTIFSDYAPSPMPVDESVAPYSSVYRPVQSFKSLTTGNGTEAGDGGSRGVWTLTVTDKAEGDASRRPLKLTGWELWLCGETAGPLFAPDKDAEVAAFSGAGDSSEGSVTVVKKEVAPATNVDVDVLVKAGYRAAQVEQDLISQAIGKVNTMLSKEIAAKFEAANGQLKNVNPQLAGFLSSSMASTLAGLQELPATMGYLRDEDGSWTLPTSEVVIKSFLDTLVHCYHNIYWCWENTGLRGNLALDFASTWGSASGAVAAGWSAAQSQWIDAIGRFTAQYPSLDGWADTLFYSVIDTLYDAAALDAVTSVGEAYIDTAIRLAIFATPIRYVVNPRAFFTQLLILVSNILRTVFNAFQYVPVLIDGDTNNDVAAITTIASILAESSIDVNAVLLEGVGVRLRGMEQNLAASAGGLARAAADLSSNFGDTLSRLSPSLGAAFKSGADPIEAALEGLAASQQDQVTRYFRSQRFRASGLEQELGRTMGLMGDVTVALARNTAEAFVAAQRSLDEVLPGPPVQQVLSNLTKDVQGILSDAAGAIEQLLPLPEIEEMRTLIEATINGTLDILQASAKEVQDSEGAAVLRDQLKNLAEGLNSAASGMSSVIDGIVKGFPGPLLNSTLAVIERQTNRTIVEIRNLFETIARDFPNLNPKFFIDTLGRLLEQLLEDTIGQAGTFESIASFTDVQNLANALPGVLDQITTAVPELQGLALQQLPAPFVGKGPGSEALRQIDQGIGETLKTYAERVQAVAAAFPNQPPIADITANLQNRSQQLAKSSNQLLPAVAEAIAAPTNVLRAGVSDLNNGLTALLEDLDSQARRAPELAQLLATGPLARVANELNSTVGNVAKDVASAVDGMVQLLPDLPELRPQLQALLGPQVDALDRIVAQASRQAVDAAAAASQGALLGLGSAMTGITSLLKDAQFQLAGLLGAAAQAGKSLNATLSSTLGNDTKPAPLVMLDQNLAELGNNIARDVNNTLTALRPPIQVLEGVVRPLAAALNDTLGGVTALLTGAPVSTGITGVLQLLANFATAAIQGVSGALQLPLPPLPTVPPLPGADKNNATSNSTSPSGRRLLQDDATSYDVISLEDYYALVDSRIRPTLESLGTDNATIVQLVKSTASFLFSLEAFPGDVNFATRAAQDLQALPAAALAAVQERLQPIIDELQARTNGKDNNKQEKPNNEGDKPEKPGKPEALEKPSKGEKENDKPEKPEKAEKPSKEDDKEKPEKPVVQVVPVNTAEGARPVIAAKPIKPEGDKPEKSEKPEKDEKEDHQHDGTPQLPPLPDFSQLFNVTVTSLQGLLNGDGSTFNPAEFVQVLGAELQNALTKFAQEFTGTLLGAPGVSGSDGAQQVLQGLGNTVQDAVGELERSISSLPRGPVFDLLMAQGAGVTGDATDAAVRTLQQLQQQLVTVLDGAGDALNVTSPEELTQLVRSAGTALQSLADSPIGQQLSSAAEQVMAQSGVLTQNGGQLVSQLAQSLTPVSEAAGVMLQGFRESLSQLVMPLLGGQ